MPEQQDSRDLLEVETWSRRFLEDALAGTPRHRILFAVDIFLPFEFLFRVIQCVFFEWLSAHFSALAHPAVRVILGVLLLVVILVMAILNVPWSIGLYPIALCLNVLAFLLLYVFSGLPLAPERTQQQLSERLGRVERSVSAALDTTARDISSKLDKILGEKIWAGERVHDLLTTLNRRDVTRSKWTFINFLTEVVDETIEPNSDFRVSLRKPWSVCKYSSFLDHNLSHAQESVFWLIDYRDFANVLLPEFCQYALASYGHAVEDYGLTIADDTPNRLDFVFPGLDRTVHNWFDGGPVLDLTSLEPHERLSRLRELVLPVQVRVGRDYLVSPEPPAISSTALSDGFSHVMANKLSTLLPHIDAFTRCEVNKQRVIRLPSGEDIEVQSAGIDGLKNAVVTMCDECNLVETLKRSLFFEDEHKQLVPEVLDWGLKLFVETCNGPSNVWVAARTKENAGEQYVDVGIYDRTFVVRAEPYGDPPDTLRRTVIWSTCFDSPAKESAFFENGGEIKRRPFEDFANTLKRIVRDSCVEE